MLKGKESEESIKSFSNIVAEKLTEYFVDASKPLVKNIKEIVISVIILLRSVRGWYGRMTLMGIARCLQTEGSVKSRYKRLERFLTNELFQVDKMVSGLYSMVGDQAIDGMIPTLIDQTDMSGVQVISASVPYQGRALPFAMVTFEYENIRDSQNKIEKDFFALLEQKVGEGRSLVFIMDRGYAQADYIESFSEKQQLYVIRACSNVIVEYMYKGKYRRTNLQRLPYKQGRAIRYKNVKYHNKRKVVVDVVKYCKKGFKEPWILIVPADSENRMPSSLVVELYRSRMDIEVKFRDFKSMLGLRGLKLKVSRAAKIARLLVCIAIVYILFLILGNCELAQQFRKEIEVLRSKKRHGTRRTLSILTIAIFLISDSYLLDLPNLFTLLSSLIRSSFFS